jgi:L-ascorbate metabolism protein UlaG (beta-lactamase superfamily)
MKALLPKAGKVICGLGVGAHLERWGYSPEMILEGDWEDVFRPEEGVAIALEHAQHFSGRLLKWNQTLWTAFVIQSGDRKIFYSGDSGYGGHFASIGEKWGGFDAAILEDGQYNAAWHHIHLFPEETVKASKDLKAQRIITAHNSKFRIAYHDWDDPLIRVKNAAARENVKLMTPLIGEVVGVFEDTKAFGAWWEKLK